MHSNIELERLVKALFIRERFSWMGSHSGYDQLFETIIKNQPSSYKSVWREVGKLPPKGTKRFLAWLAKDINDSPLYDMSSAAAEASALWNCFIYRPQLVHIAYVESSLGFLPRFKRNQTWKLIATAHQPSSWWRLMHLNPKSICNLDALIVVSRQEVSYFSQFLPNRVFYIPHGVELDFFKPLPAKNRLQSSTNPRCVFSGGWLRDIQTLAEIVERVIDKNSCVHFDLVVPRHFRRDNSAPFYRLARHKQVSWHADISDEKLRDIYQNASVLLLPILDCTANNALLEAMACGLPIITNNVGGSCDYTNPDFVSLFNLGDVQGMTKEVLNLIANDEKRLQRGKEARLYVEQNFTWSEVALKTLDIYDKVIQN